MKISGNMKNLSQSWAFLGSSINITSFHHVFYSWRCWDEGGFLDH
jgi:hypothetical protein